MQSAIAPEKLKCWNGIIPLSSGSQWEISGGCGCSERLRHVSGLQHSSLPTLCSQPAGVAAEVSQPSRSCPAAAQMERPRRVCTQDGSHNAAILLGNMIARRGEGERGSGFDHGSAGAEQWRRYRSDNAVGGRRLRAEDDWFPTPVISRRVLVGFCSSHIDFILPEKAWAEI